ncbi:MAG TPA: hypothetical protein VIY08_04930 [Candidatus Nitrosocosmicus sp.]
MTNINYSTKTKSPEGSILIYIIMSIGVAMQIGGANWDIVWHSSRNVETFLTPPHTLIYSGVALSISSIAYRLFSTLKEKISKRFMKNIKGLSLPMSIKISILGAIMQLTAGPFDFWWHTKFGFDGLLSPPHTILAIGMLLVAIGSMSAIYKIYKTDPSSIVNKFFVMLSSGVVSMISVGVILMFTLPFSKGQYFDFNPEPFTAIFGSIILIPIVFSIILNIISQSSKIPFIFTGIVGIIMVIQSGATIVSNSYFTGILPFYLLNILPALTLDIVLIRYNRVKMYDLKIDLNPDRRYMIASILVSLFFIPLFFPWTADVFGGFFKPPTYIRTEVFLSEILFPIIIPIVIPISLLSTFAGSYLVRKINKKNVDASIKKMSNF